MIDNIPIVSVAHTGAGDRPDLPIKTNRRETRGVVLDVACGSQDIAAEARSQSLDICRGAAEFR